MVEVLVKYNNRHVPETEIDWLLNKLPAMVAPMFDTPQDPEARVFETDVQPKIEEGVPSESHAHIEIRLKAKHNETHDLRAGHIVYALRHGIRLLAHSEGHAPSIHVLDERRLLMGIEFIDSAEAA
ncbi:hypothetical protein CCR94_12985 [Rhodoblastus sphagnicola]|uniref:Uncharacterized protein n=1 Tax=Rhodoblastus sphagnicola TaxID=333368 RepID=A0A2S6N6I6_9HYPH|nr:hypothetical protein [Rhodoblastus sphagnicola]MBB4197661.1 hypothetical protein [Rhodoblastus sphagnicola]PPQ30233.1 hypothetical protein CCR94_12985 [Rhodoblastus sphagnicola]